MDNFAVVMFTQDTDIHTWILEPLEKITKNEDSSAAVAILSVLFAFSNFFMPSLSKANQIEFKYLMMVKQAVESCGLSFCLQREGSKNGLFFLSPLSVPILSFSLFLFSSIPLFDIGCGVCFSCLGYGQSCLTNSMCGCSSSASTFHVAGTDFGAPFICSGMPTMAMGSGHREPIFLDSTREGRRMGRW